MLVGRPLDVIGIIGIILLIGIVKKNGIMLIDVAIEGQQHEGLSSEDAIHHACRLRFRPILMTTMCALLGGVPLMLETDPLEIRQPLGYAIVGGLLVSQVLTLFTTPIVFIYMDKIGQALSARVRASPPLLPERCGPVSGAGAQGGGSQPSAAFCSATSRSMPPRASASILQQLGLAERRAFGRALHLDEAARAGDDEIGVGLGGRILGVVEIDHRLAPDDAAGDGGDVVPERALLEDRALHHPVRGSRAARSRRR